MCVCVYVCVCVCVCDDLLPFLCVFIGLVDLFVCLMIFFGLDDHLPFLCFDDLFCVG